VNVIPTSHCDCCTLCHINVDVDLPTWCHGKKYSLRTGQVEDFL
jgi:hypothetical protein